MIAETKHGTISANFRKYYAVVRINTQNSLAYTWDAVSQGILIAIFILIFARLWKVTFAAQGAEIIGDLTLRQTIWYFVWAEAIQLSKMNVSFKMQEEVQGGSLAYTLGRPYNYLLYHFFSGVGEVFVRMASTLAFGMVIAWIEAGTPSFIRWETLPLLLMVTVLALVVDFCMSAMIGLTAFFFEDTMAFRLIYQKLLLVLGGVLLPLDFLPGGVQTVTRLLPFNAVIYAPARLFVAWDSSQFLEILAVQGFWIAALGFLLALFFHFGTQHVSINGG